MARKTYHIRVPHADRVLDAQLAHEHAVHPPEAKLYKLDAILHQVRRERLVYSRDQLAERRNLPLDAGLRVDVVVLDPVQQLGQAPERVGLDHVEHVLGQGPGVERLHIAI